MAGKKIVVLGASLSGPVAAARAKETDPKAKVTLVGRAKEVSYAPGGLPYRLSEEVQSVAALETAKAKYFRDLYGIDVRARTSVEAIDVEKRRVRTDGGTLRYDALIYALGARVVWPQVAGLREARNVSTLRDLGDLRRLEKLVDAKASGPGRVVILGAGYYGVEAADCLVRRGVPVTLVEAGVPLSGHTSWVARRVRDELARVGVDVRVGTLADSVTRSGARITDVHLRRTVGAAKGAKMLRDVRAVLVTSGVQPRSELLAAHGAQLTRSGAIVIDQRAATSIDGVYATSIAAAHADALRRAPRWTAQAADADKSAQVAGENAAGGDAVLRPTLGTSIVRVGALAVGATGRRDGVTHEVLIRAPSREPFFPGGGMLSILLGCDAKGRLRYAEVVGTDGVDKRIDVLATAMQARMSAEDLATLDLAYSPPYAAVRDPVHVAGRMLALQRRGEVGVFVDLEATKGPVIDVRTPAARRARPCPRRDGGPAPEAIPLTKLADRRARLRRKGLVFVCETGREAYLAAAFAAKHGAQAPTYLMGGLAEHEATRGLAGE